MKKITGKDNRRYIAVGELRYEIARLRKEIPLSYHNFTEKERAMVHLAYNDILRALYRDELREAQTPDEVREICDMEGDYAVIRGSKKDGFQRFVEWADKKPVIADGVDGMVFSYKGMAEHVAETLNEAYPEYGADWRAQDISPWATADAKRLLAAIFEENETPAINEDVSETMKNYAED